MVANEESVDVVVPNLGLEEAIFRVDPPDWVTSGDVRVVGYPKYIFGYEVTLKRVLISDRTVDLSVTVDAVTGGRNRNDDYPNIERRTLPTNGLIRHQIDREDALEKSRAVVRRHISFHFPTSVLVRNLPDMVVDREDFVYTLYWLIPTGAEGAEPMTVAILDTISGEVVEQGVNVGEVTVENLQ